MKVNWYEYAKARPAKAGTYLAAFADIEEGSTELFQDVAEYYMRGDLLTTETKNLKGDTAEERMIDSMFNPEHQIVADSDGFFEIDDDDANVVVWEVKPVWWAEYPEAPEGMEWSR